MCVYYVKVYVRLSCVTQFFWPNIKLLRKRIRAQCEFLTLKSELHVEAYKYREWESERDTALYLCRDRCIAIWLVDSKTPEFIQSSASSGLFHFPFFVMSSVTF